jgi:hypothetical protein
MKNPSELDLLDDSLTVCWVSIFLSLAVPGAQIEHECTDGVHRFIVLRDGGVYELSIEHDALSRMDADELLGELERLAITIPGEIRQQLLVA